MVTLDEPMDAAPGERWVYNSGASQLLSAVIHEATGRHIDEYAARRLFAPLALLVCYQALATWWLRASVGKALLGLRVPFHEGLMALTGLGLPLNATGSFNPFAWQLLWVIGLWLGTARLQRQQDPQRWPVLPLQASPRSLVLIALLAVSRMYLGVDHPTDRAKDP